MLIDYLTERYYYSGEGLWISLLFYTAAALVALLLRRQGQARAAKKHGAKLPGFPAFLLQDLTSGLWAVFFFLLTGCLKGPLHEEDSSEDRHVNRKVFWGGVLWILAGTVGFFFLHTVLQIFAGNTVINLIMVGTKALTAAHLSLLIFSLLPLPGSDAERLLLQPDLGKKRIAFRKQGTLPFLLFTVVGLLLASIALPVADANYSLSYVITLFPVILIGG